ncbi:MAG TPA: hypothetical protein VIH56_03205 [Candidatus Acidoferrales bacterium]
MTLSAESQINQAMKDLEGLTADSFCAIVGIPPTRLSQALRQIRPLDNQQALYSLKVLNSIKDLVNRCDPVPVSLKNPKIIKELLEKLDDGSLQISVIRK